MPLKLCKRNWYNAYSLSEKMMSFTVCVFFLSGIFRSAKVVKWKPIIVACLGSNKMHSVISELHFNKRASWYLVAIPYHT